MNSNNYKQYDTRWNYLPYPTKRWNIGNSGCGEVSICNIIIEMNKWLNDTPKTIQPYCVQYAAPNGDGTYWSGIPAMMKHYGMTEVKEHDTMQQLFKELAKGDRVAVYLMGSAPAGSNKVHWTSGGHFVSSVLYEKRGSEDWVYMKDPNSTSSLRNGWMSYNGNIRGACLKVWSGKLSGASPQPTPTPPSGDKYPGPYPVVKKYLEPGDRGENVTRLQNYLNWYTDGAFFKECGGADGVYGNNTLKYVKKMQTDFFGAKEADGLVGNKTIDKMKAYSKSKKPTPTPTPSKDTKVIDVSAFQDSINWAKVKAAGIDGAMIRCGYRGYETGKLNQDGMFVNHISGASKAGLKVGVYFFTEAINYSEGKQEAEFTLGLIEKMGIKLYYPIAVDTEAQNASTERAKNLSKAQRTDAIKGFCETIKANGYTPMIYASTSWFENKLDMSKLPYDCWCAQYYKECQYKGKVVMWQYTSEGSVNGVKGVVDMNKCYITSAAPMPKPTPKPEPAPSGGAYTGAYPTEAEMKQAQVNGMAQACKDQTSWAYDSIYKWESYPTVPKSKIKGTCVTYVGCVLQRTGVLPEGKYIWHDGRGYGDGKVTGTNGQMTTTYYNNKKSLKDISMQTCDIVLYDDNKSGERGNGGHIEIFNGVKNGNYSYFYTGGTGSHKNTSNNRKEPNSRKVLAIVRVKYRGYIKKGDRGAAVLKWQDYLNWWSNGAFYKECGKGDSIFGNNTHKWTVKFQEAVMGKGQGDGTVGPKTIAAAKSVKK